MNKDGENDVVKTDVQALLEDRIMMARKLDRAEYQIRQVQAFARNIRGRGYGDMDRMAMKLHEIVSGEEVNFDERTRR